MIVTVITYWCRPGKGRYDCDCDNVLVSAMQGSGDMIVTVITYWCWRGKGRYDYDCDNVLVLAREGAI